MKQLLLIIFLLQIPSISFGKSFYQDQELERKDTMHLFVEDFENQLILEVKFIEKALRKNNFFKFLDRCSRVCITMRINLNAQRIKVVKVKGYQDELEKPVFWNKKVLAVKPITEIRYTRIMKNGPNIYPIVVCMEVNNGQIVYPKNQKIYLTQTLPRVSGYSLRPIG